MHRWKLSALAAAALVSLGMHTADALALTLGRISVQSALGEPLRAQVELPQLTAAEAESLQASVASPGVFRAQGIEYSSTANTVRVSVERLKDGSAVLRLTSPQVINDPFVDLVLEASWAAGNLRRNYTLLLDPPAVRRAAPEVTAQAQISAAPVTSAARRSAATASQAPERSASAGAVEAPASRSATSAARASRPQSSGTDEVRIQSGDTAGRIASAHRPGGISLDQMLVAMLRANPHAFIDNNVNRMRAGVVINMPDAQAAQATSPTEARQIVSAQARDFNAFRRQLARSAPEAPTAAAERVATGRVQTQVQDQKSSAPSPDTLTLSKGAVKGVEADERLAQEKQAQSQSSRMTELQRNMSELSQIAAATAPAATPAAAGAAPSPATATPAETATTNGAANLPGIAVPAPAALADAAANAQQPPAAATDASASDASSPAGDAATTEPVEPPAAEATPAPEAAHAPVPAPAANPVPPMAGFEDPSLIDSLMEDPVIPLAGAALLALLLGYGGYRVAQRRRARAVVSESAFGDSQLAADSFFGASGGQRIDTGASSQMSAGTSMHYSPSQLDAGGEVDPVAEADVYLAYGRDLQAEEIIKEALRTDPQRLSLHQKLADIYAKRLDHKAFEAVATNLFALTQGQGPEWQRLAEQGRVLDAANPLYQPGNSVASAASTATRVASGLGATAAFAGATMAASQPAEPDDSRDNPPTIPMGLDFDLAVDLPGGLADAQGAPPASVETPPPAPIPSEQDFAALEPTWRTPAPAASHDGDTVLHTPDFSAALAMAPAPAAANPFAATERAPLGNTPEAAAPDFAMNLDFSSTGSMPEAAAPQDGLQFHLNGLDSEQPQAATASLPPGPLESADDAFDFDLGNLSLDLGNSVAASGTLPPSVPEDPLATKLDLAQEFNAIGDTDGARTLIEEVIAEAGGELKARAQQLLSQID